MGRRSHRGWCGLGQILWEEMRLISAPVSVMSVGAALSDFACRASADKSCYLRSMPPIITAFCIASLTAQIYPANLRSQIWTIGASDRSILTRVEIERADATMGSVPQMQRKTLSTKGGRIFIGTGAEDVRPRIRSLPCQRRGLIVNCE